MYPGWQQNSISYNTLMGKFPQIFTDDDYVVNIMTIGGMQNPLMKLYFHELALEVACVFSKTVLLVLIGIA